MDVVILFAALNNLKEYLKYLCVFEFVQVKSCFICIDVHWRGKFSFHTLLLCQAVLFYLFTYAVKFVSSLYLSLICFQISIRWLGKVIKILRKKFKIRLCFFICSLFYYSYFKLFQRKTPNKIKESTIINFPYLLNFNTWE